MDKLHSNKRRIAKRKKRIKKKILNHPGKLRLCINRSNKNMYAQIIDDTKSQTIVALSTQSKDFPELKTKKNVEAAKVLGKMLGESAVQKGIKKVVFDRNGYLYHGKIKAFADAAREAGLEF